MIIKILSIPDTQYIEVDEIVELYHKRGAYSQVIVMLDKREIPVEDIYFEDQPWLSKDFKKAENTTYGPDQIFYYRE